jgi:DNA segregation ATPase FtsK/SpoIIIE, S-DNA-T family
VSTTDETTTNGVVVPFARPTTEHTTPTPAPVEPTTTVKPTPEVVEAELVDDKQAVPVEVDQPGGPQSSWIDRLRATERLPIIPEYLRTLADAKATATWTAKHYAHTTGYHAVRAPLYLLKLAARAPYGALLLAAATGRWVSDAEGRAVRREMAEKGQR